MSTEDRQAALARVQHATEEWRKTIDVLLRLTAALESAPDANAMKGLADELRQARRKAATAAREAQHRLDATLAAICAPVRVPERRPPPLPSAAMPPLSPADDEPSAECMAVTRQGDEQ